MNLKDFLETVLSCYFRFIRFVMPSQSHGDEVFKSAFPFDALNITEELSVFIDIKQKHPFSEFSDQSDWIFWHLFKRLSGFIFFTFTQFLKKTILQVF